MIALYTKYKESGLTCGEIAPKPAKTKAAFIMEMAKLRGVAY
jgi:hypothetical protein